MALSMETFRGCPHLVLGNQCLGTGTKWCCVHTLSTRYVSVYISYSISPCQPPFSNLGLAARTKQWIGLPRTYKKYVHTGTRCPLLCPNSRVGIHPHVIKESSAQVAPFLKYIFQKSLEPSKFPEDWREATICCL